VTEIPGTTRDAIEAPVTCDGFPFRLIDTAGLRESDDRIEKLGIEVSKQYLGDADVVLFCVEAGRALDVEEEVFWSSLGCPKILVSTKSDLHAGASEVSGLLVSSETGSGVAELRVALAALAFATLCSRARIEPLITRERHRMALRTALDEVQAFGAARASGLESAVSAVHLRAAVGALEDVIGVVSTDDVLEQVFSSFCVGK